MNFNDLTFLYNKEYISEIDIYFARFIHRLSDKKDPDISLTAALVSRAAGEGNVCLDLAAVAKTSVMEEIEGIDPVTCPGLSAWRKKLLASSAVGKPGDFRPLILDAGNRLYLYRYWQHEQMLSESIKERIGDEIEDINVSLLMDGIHRLFSGNETEPIDWQKVAVIPPIFKKFSVISGGPGTGKTFTVAKILALLLEQHRRNPLRILLCAPTGKAAAKLGASIKLARELLNCKEEIKTAIPENTYTIHRMLGSLRGTPCFRHHRKNPLPADVILVDEASMVDLALMSRLIDAVPPNARLILMGDKDQLASVEAGSVLGDMCNRNDITGYSNEFIRKVEMITHEPVGAWCKRIEHGPGLHDCMVILQKNYRFSAASGIASLSRAVNCGDAEQAICILEHSNDQSIKWKRNHLSENILQMLEKKILEGYSDYLQTNDPYQALEFFTRFKILCAVRKGPFGVDTANRLAEYILAHHGLIDPDGEAYRGKPILMTRNDYHLGLFNGDMGIMMPVPGSNRNTLHAFFHGPAGELKHYPAHQLSNYETAYAITVHKSQGSEFDTILLILPDRPYPVLTRELLYTGITRARKKVTIWGSEKILRGSVQRKIERTSGLRDALWCSEPIEKC